MASVGYITVGSNQLDQAKAFYDALLGSIGMRGVLEHGSGGRIYSGKDTGVFGVLGPYDGQPATVGNGGMAGFGFDTPEEVAAFHAKAMELGAVNEGDPGQRGPGVYFAYFRDLDGNKLCGYKFG